MQYFNIYTFLCIFLYKIYIFMQNINVNLRVIFRGFIIVKYCPFLAWFNFRLPDYLFAKFQIVPMPGEPWRGSGICVLALF